MQAPLLTHPQALTAASGIRERIGFSALPFLVQRTDELRKAFLAQILAALAYCVNTRGKIIARQIIGAFRETRRQEAVRIIHRYRHLIHSDTNE